MKFTIFSLVFTVVGALFAGANDIVPAPPQKEPVLLTGGTIHPVSGEPFEGFLLFEAGKIVKLGKAGEDPAAAEGTRVVDLGGGHVYPGMIGANTVLGLTEIRAVRATVDMTEPGSINPNARAEVAVDPDSELFPVTRSNGVLHALSVPQTRGLIAGTSALMALDGWTWEAMTARAPVGMHIRWPRFVDPGRARDSDHKKSLEESRKGAQRQRRMLEESFAKARAYLAAKKAGEPTQKTDLRWEAMAPVLAGDIPIFVHAEHLKQIADAVAFASDQGVKMVLVGGGDAWRAAPLLKENDIPVVISGVNELPSRRWEDYDTAMRLPLALHQAGVRFCIAGSGSSMAAAHERNLPYEAARAAAFGLPPAEALKAVTLYAAQILGVGERLGSLEVGKDATLMITSGDPLEITTEVRAAFIAGRELDLARYLVGEIKTVSCLKTNFVDRRPLPDGGDDEVTVDDASLMNVEFEGGAIGSFECTRYASGRKNHNQFEINGSLGSVVFDLERMNELEFFSKTDPQGEQGFRTILATDPSHDYVGNWWPPGHIIGYEHEFVHAAADFLNAVSRHEPIHPDFADGVACMRVLDAASRSAESGRRETV